jgi:hypothetical protein
MIEVAQRVYRGLPDDRKRSGANDKQRCLRISLAILESGATFLLTPVRVL